MTFDDLPAGVSAFLDANSLVYPFAPEPVFGPPCAQLLRRIENQELLAFTATHVLSEVAHRLMAIEAVQKFGWPVRGIAQRLRQHPAHVQQLRTFHQTVERILQSRVRILAVSPPWIATAAILSQQTGRLSNDALIVAVMQNHGLVNLASNDADFDRMPGLTRYAPA
ncbi:MAG: type II toxin-antitoxin system VapC family toxin [Thermoguttaceae bacterium]|jgi:predicted nucleic acid-binding protein